jgi:hypothetical protein
LGVGGINGKVGGINSKFGGIPVPTSGIPVPTGGIRANHPLIPAQPQSKKHPQYKNTKLSRFLLRIRVKGVERRNGDEKGTFKLVLF